MPKCVQNLLDAFISSLVSASADEVGDEHDEHKAGQRRADDDGHQVANLRVRRAVLG